MMQVTCQWCGHRYTMKRDALAYAVAAAQAANAKHHVENCPKCRKVMKIPVAELKRHLPPGSAITPVASPSGGARGQADEHPLPQGSPETSGGDVGGDRGRAEIVENPPPGTPLPDLPSGGDLQSSPEEPKSG
jgi:hypothetical protein